MKKLKNLLTLSALAVCLAGMVFAFGVSAEDASKPEIISKNVKYTDKFILMYAVDAETVDGNEATLKVYDEYPTEASTPICTLKDTTTETIKKADGTTHECYVFTTNGISATAFTTNYYVTVTDGKNVSDVERYSVAEYLNERLYKNGIAAVTEGADATRKDFYLSTLAFGANAEKVLFNLDDDDTNNRKHLVTDYKYIYTDLGTIDGEFSSGVYAPETTLTFTPADAAKKYQTTEILASGANGNGTAIAADGKFTVNATARIDFKVYERGEGRYWNEIGNTLTDGYLAYNFNANGASLNGFGGAVHSDGTTFATGSNIDGAATLTRIANSWATAHFYYNRVNSEFPGDFSDATCKVFEFDYKISHMLSGTNDGRQFFRLDDNDYIKIYRNSDGTTLSLGAKNTATITPGEWCNIRLEFYKVNGTKYVQIYVNDTYAYTQTLTSATNTYNNRIYFYLEAATSVGTTICVDNFVMAFITKDYVANP